MELTPVAQEGYAIDGPSIKLLDHSPTGEVQDLTGVPLAVIDQLTHTSEWVIFRLAWQLHLREVYREAGHTAVARALNWQAETRAGGD